MYEFSVFYRLVSLIRPFRTHIITCSLTPAKIKEFQYMKVVRPEWLVNSVEAGVLLPWKDFIFKPMDRTEVQQGTAQRTLASAVASQSSRPTTSHGYSENPPPYTPRDPRRVNIVTPTPLPEAGPSKLSHPPQKYKSSPSRPSHINNSSTSEEAKKAPEYAADKSNIAAQKAMADPAWRAAHTSIAPDFIDRKSVV